MSDSKKIVLAKNKFSNSQATSSQFSRPPYFPPLPITQTQNRFTPLTPQVRPRPPFSSIVKTPEAKPIVQASTSTPISSNTLPYITNPNTKIIKILEPTEVDKIRKSFLTLIDFLYPRGCHFYQDEYKTREYYQAILIDSESAIIRHNFNKEDPSKIAYSQVKILKILTLEDWNSKPYISKTLSNFPSYPQFNYYDYQEAWDKAFLLRNYDHSWFFQFDDNFSNIYPRWFVKWFKYMGIRPEAFPKEISEAFSKFTTYFQQDGIPIFEYVLQFMSIFRIPWISSWTYIFEDENPSSLSPPLLHRQYKFKWWNKFSVEKANTQKVNKYYKDLIAQSEEKPLIQDSTIPKEDQDYIQRIQACGSQEEMLKILNEIRHSPSPSRKSSPDTEIFQDSQDPYDMI